jgi:hypothetical protein
MTPILHEARIKLGNLQADIIRRYNPYSANLSSCQCRQFLTVKNMILPSVFRPSLAFFKRLSDIIKVNILHSFFTAFLSQRILSRICLLGSGKTVQYSIKSNKCVKWLLLRLYMKADGYSSILITFGAFVPSMCNVTLTAQKLQKPDLYSATEC